MLNQTTKSPYIVIIFFFVSLLIFTKVFGPITFSVNNTNTEIPFQTTGTGEATAVPNKASVSLGVTQNSATSDDARAKVNEIINKVTSDLETLGIKESDIKTTNFSVYPNDPAQPTAFDNSAENSVPGIMPPRPIEIGFTASANLDVETDSIDTANKAIDIATRDGANVIGGVSFTFDDNKQKQLENEARINAVKDAKDKAQTLASAAGIKLGKVTNITEDDYGYPYPMDASVKAGSGASDQTSLNPGENKVTKTVTLTFETN